MAKIIKATVYSNPHPTEAGWRNGPVVIGTVYYTGPLEGDFRHLCLVTSHDKDRATRLEGDDALADAFVVCLRRLVAKGLGTYEYSDVKAEDV